MRLFYRENSPNIYTFILDKLLLLKQIMDVPKPAFIVEEKPTCAFFTKKLSLVAHHSREIDRSLSRMGVNKDLMRQYDRIKNLRQKVNIINQVTYMYRNPKGETILLPIDKTDVNAHPIRLFRLGVFCLNQHDSESWQQFLYVLKKLEHYDVNSADLLSDEDIVFLDELANTDVDSSPTMGFSAY